MAEQAEITEIAQQLSSSNSATRHKGFKNLKLLLNLTHEASFKKIAVGLYYFYRLSEGLNEQLADRAALCGLLDLIKPDDQLKWLETFITVIVELWHEIDLHRVDKYLKLMREWFLTCYGWLDSLSDFKKIWIKWNHFMLTQILFNPTGHLSSSSRCASVSSFVVRLFRPFRA